MDRVESETASITVVSPRLGWVVVYCYVLISCRRETFSRELHDVAGLLTCTKLKVDRLSFSSIKFSGSTLYDAQLVCHQLLVEV